MDEALFTHRAGQVRRGLRQVWAVGMVERDTGTAFIFVVRTRDAITLNNLILQHIQRGSIIVTDGWRGYSRIPRSYRHIDMNDNPRYNTSQVEGLWGQIRARIRTSYGGGIIEDNVYAFLV